MNVEQRGEMWAPTNRIEVLDTTMRDGAQTQGVHFTDEDKMRLATEMHAAGIDIIEIGYPGASDGEKQSCETVMSMIVGPKYAVLSRANVLSEIDLSNESLQHAYQGGGGRHHIYSGSSDGLLRYKYNETQSGMIVAVAQGVKRAVAQVREANEKYGVSDGRNDVQYSAEDATRTQIGYLVDVVGTAVENGATVINLPDTVGWTEPDEYKEMVEIIAKAYPNVKISTHCHNDLEMAVANTLAAIKGGARQVETSFIGLGERTGNANITSVIAAIIARAERYKVWHNIDPKKLGPLSYLISEITGREIPPFMPVIGATANSHVAGQHQKAVAKSLESYQVVDQRDFGVEPYYFPINKMSGTAALSSRAERLGFDEKQINPTTREMMDEWCDEHERDASDTDIEEIVAKFNGLVLEDVIQITESPKISVDGNKSTVNLKISFKGEEFGGEYSLYGGAIDALISGVKEMTGISRTIDNFKAKSKTSGQSSHGVVTVTVTNGELAVTASAEDPSVDHATLKAYIKGINTIERIKQRESKKEARHK